MIEGNLRLVAYIACQYQKRHIEVELEDLIQEGTLGLIRAVQEFDFSRGIRLSTYASYWIKNYIDTFIKNQACIRKPHHIWKLFYQIKETEEILLIQNQRFPSLSELAFSLQMPEKKIEQIFSIMKRTLSYDSVVSEEQDSDAFLSFFPSYEFEEDVVQKLHLEEIKQLLQQLLSKKEFQIISHHLGLFGNEEESLFQIARRMGLSKQRISVIEQRAFQKLKDNQKFLSILL